MQIASNKSVSQFHNPSHRHDTARPNPAGLIDPQNWKSWKTLQLSGSDFFHGFGIGLDLHDGLAKLFFRRKEESRCYKICSSSVRPILVWPPPDPQWWLPGLSVSLRKNDWNAEPDPGWFPDVVSGPSQPAQHGNHRSKYPPPSGWVWKQSHVYILPFGLCIFECMGVPSALACQAGQEPGQFCNFRDVWLAEKSMSSKSMPRMRVAVRS